MHGLLLLLMFASPLAGLWAIVTLYRARLRSLVGDTICVAWAFLGGVALILAGARFWRLHLAGQRLDYIFDTYEMARDLTAWSLLSISLSVWGVVLLLRRRRELAAAR